MSKPNTPTYKTLNWPEDSKVLMCHGSPTLWFDPEMARAAKPTGKLGCQPLNSDAAVSPPRKNAKPYKAITAGAFGIV